MATPARTWFDDRGLALASASGAAGPAQLPLFLGALHYWRVPPAHWEAALAGLRDLGLTAVETPVPWSVHEPAPGAWRWSGAQDLRRFTELAARAKLAVVLRVGPAANAELTGLGFPDDVLRDPEIWARTAHGSPALLPLPPRSVTLPSYASAKLHARVARWYQALAAQVDSMCAPGGPVVALAVDHEAHLSFRRGAYDLDYHPEALARWAAQHPAWPDPPRAWAADDEERCLAWVAFKEREVAWSLGRLAAALDDAGLGALARLHGLPLQHRGARAISEHLGGVVARHSHGPVRVAELRRNALRALGSAALPLALECGVGEAPWFPPSGGPAADQARAVTLLAAGARGLGFSMAVERERWAGGLVDTHGRPLPGSQWAPALLRALQEVDFPALRRRPAVAVLSADSEARLGEASCLMDPLPPVVSQLLGLGEAGHAELGAPSAAVARRWQAAVELALERAGVAYAVLDEEAPGEELARYRAVIAPVATHLSRALWHTLQQLVEHHPVTVVLGPWAPERDERGQPWQESPLSGRDAAAATRRARPGRVGRLRPGSLEDLEGLAADLAPLADPLPFRVATAECALELAWDAGGAPRALFVFNDAALPQTAELHVRYDAADDGARPTAVRDVFSGERIAVVEGMLRVPLPPASVRMFLTDF
ncbi:MAG: beta-galactosidase [Myxococcales bacterium]|nr:beta-galactosidase [Myxococcales bacterium]